MGKDKKDNDDEIPLTRELPSITQETKARFESLLNAALKNELSKNIVSVNRNNVWWYYPLHYLLILSTVGLLTFYYFNENLSR